MWPRTTGEALAGFPKLEDAASAPLMLTDASAAPAPDAQSPAEATAVLLPAEDDADLPARFARARGGGKRSAPTAVPLLTDASAGLQTRGRKKKQPKFDLGGLSAEQLSALSAQIAAMSKEA